MRVVITKVLNEYNNILDVENKHDFNNARLCCYFLANYVFNNAVTKAG